MWLLACESQKVASVSARSSTQVNARSVQLLGREENNPRLPPTCSAVVAIGPLLTLFKLFCSQAEKNYQRLQRMFVLPLQMKIKEIIQVERLKLRTKLFSV